MAKHNVQKSLTQSLITAYSTLEDPRVVGRCRYPLIEIVVIVMFGLVSGAKYWSQIEAFARSRQKTLKKFLKLEQGIPSFKTLARVMSLIPSNTFEACFRRWAASLRENKSLEVIAIDGKTLRKSSHQSIGQSAAHLVNAFASQNGITLASQKVADKTNEIKAIPSIVKSLDIQGALISIDAMGCQKGIAKLIRLKGAHYILALKKNHKRFYKKVETLFQKAKTLGYAGMVTRTHTTRDSAHSRGERREYTLLPIMYLYPYKKIWRDLETLVQVKCKRYTQKGKTIQYRYYLTSLKIHSHLRITSAIREHWGIENRLHWKLDVAFKEDQSRVRCLNAPENLATLRKVALYFLENEETYKGSIESKQWQTLLSVDYLKKVLGLT